ncbi:MAG: Ribonuclease J 1 [Microgenomates bacterium OLB23]|nr:MAG: Ribonuclease J 1 [Microgenomates bacterium OLB23]
MVYLARMYRVRFVPLGGIIGVTKNMYVYELYKDDSLQDIIIIDCGIGFPREQEFGVDLAIPDIAYLMDKKDKIRALLLTHGHEDHITALRFHYNNLGRPPVYASKLTSLLAQHKCDEYNVKLRMNLINFDNTYHFGGFKAKFIRMTHSIPDTTHILLSSPVGSFYHGSDFKMDLTPPFGYAPDFYEIAKAGKDGVLCLMSDSLGADREGFTLSESVVGKTFEDEIRTTKGRFIMTTFASNISRVRQCAEAAVKFNRRVCLLGRSMKENTKLVKDIGYFPIPPKFLIEEKQLSKYKPHEICIIATGSQGQYGSALSRLATNGNKFVRVSKGDKVLFSSDPIPGNEEEVYDIIEHLYVLGADVRYSDVAEQLHASGHGSQGDMLLLMRLTQPKHLIPIGGTIRHQRLYLELAKRMNYQDKQVHLLREGETVWFDQDGRSALGEPVITKNVYVDAYGVGDVGETILRDRMTLSTEGIVFTVLKVGRDNLLAEKPEFTSRGFIFGAGGENNKEKDTIFNGAAEVIGKSFDQNRGSMPLKKRPGLSTRKVLFLKLPTNAHS